MASGPLGTALRSLDRLFSAGTAAGVSDGEVLERYLTRGDEAAFEALVVRHGPMVLAVCRRTLVDPGDLDDAFQATFLVLARRARSVRDRAGLGVWLHGVARRVCLLANRAAARRRQHERRAAEQREVRKAATMPRTNTNTSDELGLAIDEEIDRLPAAYRLPVVLCLLEGKTQASAAAELRWTEGMVRGRLARARQRLRSRLIRRGLAPAAALAMLAGESEGKGLNLDAASLPAELVAKAVRAAAGGVPASAAAAALTDRWVGTTIVRTLTLASTLSLAGVLALAIGAAASALIASEEPPRPNRAVQAPAPPRPARPPAAQADRGPHDPAGSALVLGQVLDPDGKPAPGAQVAVVYQPNATRASEQRQGIQAPRLLATAQAGPDGRFRLEVPRASLDLFPVDRLLAHAEGFGLGLRTFDPGPDRQELTVRLTPDQVIRGRLVDLQGAPAAGVKVDVTLCGNLSETGEGDSVFDDSDRPLAGVPFWPAATTSDGQGRFTLRGIGQYRLVALRARGEAYADQALVVRNDNDRPAAVRDVTYSLMPATILRGRVTREDSGAPLPRARLVIHKGSHEGWLGGPGLAIDTDDDGRYRASLPSYAGEGEEYRGYLIWCYPPADASDCFGLARDLKGPEAQREHTLDFALPRGQVLRGKITERPSGRPVAGASVIYGQRPRGNPHLREDLLLGWDHAAVSGADGAFRATVLPGPGYLSVYGPSADYVFQELGSYVLFGGGTGGSRMFAHAWELIDPKPGEEHEREVSVTLQRGATIHARIVGPDGQPDPDAVVYCVLNQQPGIVRLPGHGFPARGGRFDFTGCDPARSVSALVLDHGRRLGATVTISGKQAGEELTIRLAPCGSARLRCVDDHGQPLARLDPRGLVDAVLVPESSPDRKKSERLEAILNYVGYPDPSSPRAFQGEPSDAQGRVTLHGLVPGATYRIGGDDSGGWREFTVAAGQTVDLGDVKFNNDPD